MSKAELQYKLLLYLDKRHFLAKMRNNCDSFLEQCTEKTNKKFPPLRHLLEIDVMDLLDVFPELGIFLIHEPLQFQRISNEILFACIKSIDNDNTKNVQAMQAAVNIRLKCFPPFLSYPNQRYYNGIMLFNGLLIYISKPNSYVYHTVWSCPEECEGNEVILHFIPSTPPKCDVCRSVLFENSGLRRCGDKVTATFVSNNDLSPQKYTIVDDLITRLKVGTCYSVLVVTLKKIKAIWSLDETISLPAPITYPIPEDIKQLSDDCNGVPWKFIYCLASTIGVRVCPLICFIHVKICLLLSLVSVKANSLLGSPIINVLVTGYDTKYVGELLREAAKFANRSVSLANSFNCVDLSMISSSGGICFLPLPLYLYNQKQLALILKTLENGEVNTENGEIKLQCGVWAYSNESRKILISNLSSIFGTVCRGDYGQYSDELAEFMLKGAVEQFKKSKDEIKAMNDLMSYINLTANIGVTLDKTAESLLKGYFLAARKASPKVATISSIGSLVAVSLTSARLCRRSIASNDDALLAIWLHVCGSPEPRFAPEEFLQTPESIHKLQENMSHFKEWLVQFTGCYTS